MFLSKKRELLQANIKKLKRKRKIIKILYYGTVTSSVSLSVIIASLSGVASVPIILMSLLSIGSGILTGIAANFNFQDKKI